MNTKTTLKSLVLSTVFCLAAAAAMAVPAKRIQQRIRLTDGSEITATLRGDERVSYYETSNGTLYIRQADGLYRPTSRLEIQLRANERLMAENVAEQIRLAANPKANVRRRAPRKGESLTDAYIGAKKGLVILVNFKDKSFAEANPQHFFERMFNEQGFTEDGQTGSVHDYYYDQSYGLFDLTFDVVGPITLSQSMSHYGGPEGDAHDRYDGMVELVSEACKAVDGQVDFSTYDWNKDGFVDQVYIIYAGYGQATGGDENTIWPHKSFVQNGPTLDNTTIGTYACNNELNGGEGSKQRMGIGTACHEFSHCLGLPDFYNTTEGSGGGPEHWDIMSGGSYNGNGRCPVGYSSYERWTCGWLTPTELDKPTTVTDMASLEAEATAYILTHDTYENEYFLLENRQPIKWDKETGGKGMLIFHVDYDEFEWAYNTPNNNPDHERMKLIAADGDATSNPEGDPYPGPNGLRKRFADTSTPSATLYNLLPDGSKKLGKPIEDIKESAQGIISFTALKGTLPRTQITETNVTKTGFSIAWDAVEGAESYKLNLRAVRHPYTTPQEGEVLREDFKGCFGSAGPGSIGSSMDKYTSVKGWSGTNLFKSSKGLQIGKTGKTGTLLSPVLPATVNGELSILVRITPTGNSSAKGKLIIHTQVNNISWDFNFTEATWFYPITGPGMPDGEYTIELESSSPFAIDRFVVLDGYYEGQMFNDYFSQLTPAATQGRIQYTPAQETTDNRNTAKVTAPQRAGENTQHQTTDTQYTFTGLDGNYTYYVTVGVVGANGQSRWGKEKEIELATAIQGVQADTNASDAWFDMQGHRLSAKPTRSGIYIHNGRKVMVK